MVTPRDLEEELRSLYQRMGQIQRELAAAGRQVYGKFFDPTEIEYAVHRFAEVGFGPIRTGRYRRALTEISQFGPLGFLQRDAERLRAAITKGLPYAPMPTARQQTLIARANQLAQDILNMPLEDARRARKSLQRIVREVGIEQW